MSEPVSLPSYKEQSPEVRERFDRLKRRQVALQVEQLTRIFKAPGGDIVAIKDIDLDFFHREFITIVGPSGCGKSTLIRIIAGLETSTSGYVKVEGNLVTKPGRDRGMVFQSYTLFPWLSVKKNVMFGLTANGMSPGAAESQALQWTELVGLKGLRTPTRTSCPAA